MRANETQADLAKRLGVTQMTVSRALNGTGNLSTTAREKVQALARKLGYRPNGMARRVQEGMALLGSSTRPGYNVWEQEFHLAVGATLAQRSWHLTEGWLPGESLADPAEVSDLLDRLLADAVLVHDVGTHPPLVEENRWPVTASRQCRVYSGKSANAVNFAGAAALEPLLAQGYHRPSLLLYGAPGYPERHRAHARLHRGLRQGGDPSLGPSTRTSWCCEAH